ncbi:MAG: alpha/beta hydrolase [Polyangiaceae bacterium]|nr:alpha/beta hydrolase [Polyangiaceae bacterium]
MSNRAFPAAPRFVDLDGHRVAVRTFGQGPDVFFVHGWPLHGATWRNVAPALAEQFTCHLIDLPGCGATTLGSRPGTLTSHADVVERVIDKLGIGRLALVGHDSGGAVARLAAASLGDRVFGLVVGDTEIAGYRPPALERLLTMIKIPGSGLLFSQMLRFGFMQKSSLGFGTCFDDTSIVDGEFGDLFIKPLYQSKEAADGQLALVRDFDWAPLDNMEETHRRIVAPALLLWGVRDPWFPLRRAKKMVSQFAGGAELRELPGKLFVHEELPHLWAKHACEFLAASVDRQATAPRGETEQKHLTVS